MDAENKFCNDILLYCWTSDNGSFFPAKNIDFFYTCMHACTRTHTDTHTQKRERERERETERDRERASSVPVSGQYLNLHCLSVHDDVALKSSWQ